MESNGFGFSESAAVKTKKSLEAAHGKLEKAMKKITIRKFPSFNFNNLPDQRRLIFEVLKLEPPEGTRKNSLSKEVLEPLAEKHEAAQLIWDHRRIKKALEDISSYQKFCKNNRVFGKILLQNLTGRISINDPPLQMVQNAFKVSVIAPKIEIRNLFRTLGLNKKINQTFSKCYIYFWHLLNKLYFFDESWPFIFGYHLMVEG